MKWGEIQIESLKKMFLNKENLEISQLEEYKNDKKYKTYLFAMPQACNEAINYITSVLGGNSQIEVIERTNTNDYYNLEDLISEFGKLKDVICSNDIKWKMISETILYIENWNDEEISILYETKPDPIKSTTTSTKTINLPFKYTNLIPLYIAGELYKDDDLTLSTMYMNEFMTLVNSYSNDKFNYNNSRIETIYSME